MVDFAPLPHTVYGLFQTMDCLHSLLSQAEGSEGVGEGQTSDS